MISSTIPWFVYILECTNGKLYTGITTDIGARFHKHVSGKGAMFTRLNRPSQILGAYPCQNRSLASKLEWAIKKLPADKKRVTAALWRQDHAALLDVVGAVPVSVLSHD